MVTNYGTQILFRARVQVARDLQNTRFCGHSSKEVVSNADMRIMEIGQFCQLQGEKQKQLDQFSSSCPGSLA
jgi:predicted ATPase with chaperone activity